MPFLIAAQSCMHPNTSPCTLLTCSLTKVCPRCTFTKFSLSVVGVDTLEDGIVPPLLTVGNLAFKCRKIVSFDSQFILSLASTSLSSLRSLTCPLKCAAN